jgi:hypothetical protein
MGAILALVSHAAPLIEAVGLGIFMAFNRRGPR